MSRDSQLRLRPAIDPSSDEESLPDEWGSVQKRLDYLETTIVKLTKRTQKIQKQLHQQGEDLHATRKDTRALIEQVLQQQSKQLSVRERELQFENMRAELDDLHGYIKRVEKKSNEMVKEIRSGAGGPNLSDSRIQDKIEERVERMMQRHRGETTRAINELRRIVSSFKDGQHFQLPLPNRETQEYPRDSTPIDRKSSEKILSHSRSKGNMQRSSTQKSYKASHTEIPRQEPSIDHHLKSRSPQSQPIVQQQAQAANASSRVSYLREKLKEFEETNKRYEQKLQKRPQGTPQSKTVQKMKDFRNYLQQSQSQLDQSNLDQQPPNFLTDSIKNWKKNGEHYRYQ